jgi:hypothetical protein
LIEGKARAQYPESGAESLNFKKASPEGTAKGAATVQAKLFNN